MESESCNVVARPPVAGSRPNRHNNPSLQAKRGRKGRFQFIRKKRRETRELLKVLS